MVTQVERQSPPARRWVAAGAAGALLAPTLINPHGTGPVLCPLRRVTGVWCPGCGLTRAAGWLVHADWTAAWKLHPWVFALALQVLVGAAVFAAAGPKRSSIVRDQRTITAMITAKSLGLLALWTYRLTWGSFPAT